MWLSENGLPRFHFEDCQIERETEKEEMCVRVCVCVCVCVSESERRCIQSDPYSASN